MIYMHTINTSPESNNENDDDVIDLKTFFLEFYFFDSDANIIDYLIKNDVFI